MKVCLVVSGSHGDVRPLLALSLGLQAAGHEVLLCAPPESKETAEALGCPFQSFGSSVLDMAAAAPEPALHPFKATSVLSKFLHSETESQLRELPQILQGADLVVAATFVLGVKTVADSLGIPYRYVAYCPQIVPSSAHPHIGIKSHRRSQRFNRWSWQMFSVMDRWTFGGLLNRARSELGLPAVKNLWMHMLGERVIVASDPELADMPSDVGPEVNQVGHMAPAQNEELEPQLLDFIHAGPPPIYVGFGSMKSEDSDGVTRAILNAAAESGHRLLLSPGWGNISPIGDNAQHHMVGRVPHSKLFPRVAAVVHHGGAGTVATAARAGVPQVIVPHMTDQYYWAHRIEQLGMGPPAVWKAKLTADSLAAALGAVSNDRIRENCTRVANALRGKSGVPAAVKECEHAVGYGRPSLRRTA